MSENEVVGRELQLYDGTRIVVRAMPAFGAADFAADVERWVRQLAAHLERQPGADAGPSTEAPAITWASLLRFVLATSNPELAIDEAWCREHLYFPDLAPILKAWAQENNLEPVLESLKARATDVALDLVKTLVSAMTATAAATAARQAPPPAPGEATS